ncbi:transcriptional regulator%2C y4mF family [uncultured Flavonifractor sp.]|nr:transcriptional regulator%2C y4mF family [Flavonifractor plautii]SCJ23986.1 transcriptional regulator%2C y4mF family [uncultured Flavonifractor sp.]
MMEQCMCRLCQLRLRYSITQAELAKAAGVSRQLIGQIETEKECQSKGHEAMLRRAFACVIASRREKLDALEHDLARTAWLFSLAEEEEQDGF